MFLLLKELNWVVSCTRFRANGIRIFGASCNRFMWAGAKYKLINRTVLSPLCRLRHVVANESNIMAPL